MGTRVQVVGAGVIGLCCAIRLAEAGFAVDVLARELPADTTSATAGAVWMPYRAQPADLVAEWGRATLVELLQLNTSEAVSGVLLRDGVLVYREPPPRPAWADAVAGLTELRIIRNPAPGYSYGLAMHAPIIDVSAYLDYLLARLRQAGGSLTRLSLDALPATGIVVNATGIAAGSLVDDAGLYPVRGQTVVLDNPGLTRWLVDDLEYDGELTYVLPRRDDVVVGGCAVEGDWNREPDFALAARMLERAYRLVPPLADARVRAHRVGLRPARSAIRLEAEPRNDGVVVHCYGHGGAGFTLSWGCADAVLALVDQANVS
ncbi:MAG: FAD-binding oxidoreductase [Actinomycetota bacterium]|nr:FAD-binding oxidoreductase [Actinomycetota bacterium]